MYTVYILLLQVYMEIRGAWLMPKAHTYTLHCFYLIVIICIFHITLQKELSFYCRFNKKERKKESVVYVLLIRFATHVIALLL